MQTLQLSAQTLKSVPLYTPHLVVTDYVLEPGAEWAIEMPGWSLIQIKAGCGYCLGQLTNWNLAAGITILRANTARCTIRSSQLGKLSLQYFRVQPELLLGLATIGENQLLDEMATKQDQSFKILPAESSVSVRLKTLLTDHNGGGFLFRTQLLQTFLEACGPSFEGLPAGSSGAHEAKMRLREMLKNTPVSEFLNSSISGMAKTMNCTPRHLSRIFREVVGMSFREKQTSVRLARAREILVTTDRKIVDVALDSGYESLSLFNLMFRRRFGTSPGKWRRAKRNQAGKRIHRTEKAIPKRGNRLQNIPSASLQ